MDVFDAMERSEKRHNELLGKNQHEDERHTETPLMDAIREAISAFEQGDNEKALQVLRDIRDKHARP